MKENEGGMTMKKFNPVLIMLLAVILVISTCACQSAPPITDVSQVQIGNETITLKAGDSLKVNFWNEKEIKFNDEDRKDVPKLLGGITVGSSVDDVINAFSIKQGYCMVDYEYDPYGDGCTEIKKVDYSGTDFLDEQNILDANFIFGYKVDQDFAPMTYEEIKAYYEPGATKENLIPKVILYTIDINGLAEEAVKEKQVIAFSVSYNS